MTIKSDPIKNWLKSFSLFKPKKVNKTINLQKIIGIIQGPKSGTFHKLLSQNESHRNNLHDWNYVSLVMEDFTTIDLVINLRSENKAFLAAIGSMMPTNLKTPTN